jgi:hypothetical protein
MPKTPDNEIRPGLAGSGDYNDPFLNTAMENTGHAISPHSHMLPDPCGHPCFRLHDNKSHAGCNDSDLNTDTYPGDNTGHRSVAYRSVDVPRRDRR